MKPSKRQPPETQHRIQGVLISSDTENLVLTPCPARVRAMTQQIEKHLDTNNLTPEEARKMAGKCNFLTGRLFGKVGRAPLKAIYARANSFSHQLDQPTRSSLMALRDIILHCQPMTIPRNPNFHSFSVIYTDAYFKLKGTVYRPGDENLPQWDSRQTPDIENGWAALCFHQGDVHTGAYFQDRLPSTLLRQFSADQAFIYLLEAWAAILAPVIFEPWLGRFYVQCCDNEASPTCAHQGRWQTSAFELPDLSTLDMAQSSRNCSPTRTCPDESQHLRCPQSLRRYSRSSAVAPNTDPCLLSNTTCY